MSFGFCIYASCTQSTYVLLNRHKILHYLITFFLFYSTVLQRRRRSLRARRQRKLWPKQIRKLIRFPNLLCTSSLFVFFLIIQVLFFKIKIKMIQNRVFRYILIAFGALLAAATLFDATMLLTLRQWLVLGVDDARASSKHTNDLAIKTFTFLYIDWPHHIERKKLIFI